MKKLLILCLICLCISPVYAQRGGYHGRSHGKKGAVSQGYKKKAPRKKPSRKTPASTTSHKTHTPGTSVTAPTVQNHAILTERVNANTYAATRTALYGNRQVLRIIPTKTPVSTTGENLRVLTSEQLHRAISNDEEMRLFVPETFVQKDNTLYRGLRVKNTAELQYILERGMEIDKTKHEMIYVSPNVSVAMGYMFPRLLDNAENEALPVLIKIPVTERLLAENPPQKPQNDFGGRRLLYHDLPADMIDEVAIYANINGAEGWYRAALGANEILFTPISGTQIPGWIDGLNTITTPAPTEMATKDVPAPEMRIGKFINLPGKPTVELQQAPDATTLWSAGKSKLDVRVLGHEECERVLFPSQTDDAMMFIPEQLREEPNSLYRGMRLDTLDLKNILQNGLEMRKSYYAGEIFTTPVLWVALQYALPIDHVGRSFPVIIKLNFTQELASKIPSESMGIERTFSRDIPAKYLNAVMVFLEVDGQPGWYEARLQEGKLVLISSPGKIEREQLDF